MKQSQFQSPNTPDISMSLIGIVVGVVVGIYLTNLPLGIIFTAICVTLVLIVFKNFEISNQPSIAIIIAFLILPLLTVIDPDLVISRQDLLFIVGGIGIGLIIILGHLGAGFDESSLLLGALFLLLNFIVYDIDESGRLNLLIIWVFFALIALLTYYLIKNIPANPLGVSYVGKEGVVLVSMFPEGKVQINDEIWKAKADNEPIIKGTRVKVLGETDGLVLIVAPVE